MRNKSLLTVSILCTVLIAFTAPVHADVVKRVVLIGTINGQDEGEVVIYDNGAWPNQTAYFDTGEESSVRIMIEKGIPSGITSTYRLRNGGGYNEPHTGSSYAWNFYPSPVVNDYYYAHVDDHQVGPFRIRSRAPIYPDLIVSDLSPEVNPNYTVGQTIQWNCRVKNNSSTSTAGSSRVGYYIGTSSSDLSNRWEDDGVPELGPQETEDENEDYTFQASDVGQRYIIVKADYENDVPEGSNENNNTKYFGPFTVSPRTFTLSIAVNPSGTGTVSKSPSASEYNEGTIVTLTANPNSADGWEFDHWSGDLSGTNSQAVITMNSNKSVIANFRLKTTTLSAQISPIEYGSVLLNPDGGSYPWGTPVTLIVQPAVNKEFDHWEGDLSGTNASEVLTMNGDKSVTAVFRNQQRTLATNVLPTGTGNIILDPLGGTYDHDATVNVSVAASTGYVFDYWSGDLTGNGPSESITMDGNKSITAHFKTSEYTIDVEVTPEDAGNVSLSPSGGVYPGGTVVSTSASAYPGYRFSHWEGDVSGTDAQTSLVINGSKLVRAVFEIDSNARLGLNNPNGSIVFGQTFAIQLLVNNIADLYGHEIDIAFDPDKFEILSVTEGDFLSQENVDPTYWREAILDNGNGQIRDIVNLRLTPSQSVDGNGVLAFIELREKSATQANYDSTIEIIANETKLVSHINSKLPITEYDSCTISVGSVSTGTVSVDPNPDHLDAPWILSGPNNYSLSDNGDRTLSGLLAGQYDLAWGDVQGWSKPIPAQETLTLSAGGSRGFSGAYQELIADLMIQSPSVVPFSIATNAQFTVQSEVKNIGAIEASQSTLKYYLSSDMLLDESEDVYLGYYSVTNLPAGQSNLENTTLTMPDGTSSGNWYIIFFADANTNVPESNEDNNVGVVEVLVYEPVPDLIVENPSVSPLSTKPGGAFKVESVVRNQGSGEAPHSTLKYYLSTDSTFEEALDIYLGYEPVTNLPSGDGSPENTILNIPTDAAFGNWYILFFADANLTVDEGNNESNNVASVVFQVESIQTGDINADGDINLSDVNDGLRSMVGLTPPNAFKQADVDGDGKVGQADIIAAMISAAGIRGQSQETTVPTFYPHAGNPVYSGQAVPVVKYAEDEYRLFYNSGWTPTYARASTDGIDWSAESVQIIGSAQTGQSCNLVPFELKQDDTYKIWVSATSDTNIAGTKLYYLTSTDGINYTSQGVVLDNGTYPEYDSRNINNPFVVFDGSTYHLYYSAYPGYQTGTPESSFHDMIAYATSNDGINWTKHGVVVDVGAEGDFDSQNVSRASVVYDGTRFEMFYSASDGTESNTGYAVSSDGLNWTKVGKVDSLSGKALAGIVKTDGVYHVWYNEYDGANWTLHYATSTDPASNSTSLAVYYPFDGNARDASGNDNHGVVSAAALTIDRHGSRDRAYAFSGDDNHVVSSQPLDLTQADALTVSAWVYLTEYDINESPIVTKDRTETCPENTERDFRFFIGGSGPADDRVGRLGLYFGATMEEVIFSDASNRIGLRQWAHVAVTVDRASGTVQFYINGQQAGSGTASIGWLDTKFAVGNWFSCIGDAFNGSIDEVRVHTAVLSQAQISQLFNTNGEAVYYPFSGNADDDSGNENHGVVSAAALTSDRHGNPDSAYAFSGDDNHILSSQDLDLTTADALTVSAWVYLTEYDINESPIITKDRADTCPENTERDLRFFIGGSGPADDRVGRLGLYFGATMEEVIFSDASNRIGLQQWTHVAVSVDRASGAVQFFINGQLAGSGTASIGWLNTKFVVGNWTSCPGDAFNGSIDEVRIYLKQLTENEIYRDVHLDSQAAYYPFNGNVLDMSGKGADGIASAGITYDVGKFGQAAVFDGVSDYVQTPLMPVLQQGESLSTGLWMKTDGEGYLCGLQTTGGQQLGMKVHSDGLVLFIFRDDDWNEVRLWSETAVNDNAWHHIVAVRDGTNAVLRLYVDGVLDGEAEDTTTAPMNASDSRWLAIGADNNSSDGIKSHFPGGIDEFRFFNRALNPLEVTSLFFYATSYPAPGAIGSFQNSVNVNDTPAGVAVEGVDIISGDQGGVVVGFADKRTAANIAYATQSTDGGVTWGGAQAIGPDAGDHPNPPVFAAAKNTADIYAVFRDGGNIQYFNRTSDGGGSWAGLVGTGIPTYYNYAGIDTDSTGTIYTVGSSISGSSVAVAKSTDQGATWETPVQVHSGSEHYSKPAIAVDDAGSIYLAFTEHPATPQCGTLYFSKSTDAGTTWSIPTAVTRPGTGICYMNTNIAAVGNGSVYLMWEDNGPSTDEAVSRELYMTRSIDGGQNWQDAVRIDAGSHDSVFTTPSAFEVDGNGNGFAVWSQTSNGVSKVYFSQSRDAGDTWMVPLSISDRTDGNQNQACLSVGEDGSVNIAYYHDGTDPGVYYTKGGHSATALSFSDLTNIDLSGLSYGQGTSCSDANYVAFRFFNYDKDYYYGERKGVDKTGCSYVDGNGGTESPIMMDVVIPYLGYGGGNIVAGDYLTITYDSGQTLEIYLPDWSSADDGYLNVYVASDGSTYWDAALTQLAQAAP